MKARLMCEYLNELLELDRSWVSIMFRCSSVGINSSVKNDGLIGPIHNSGGKRSSCPGGFSADMLALINGILGPKTMLKIVWDSDNEFYSKAIIKKFIVIRRPRLVAPNE